MLLWISICYFWIFLVSTLIKCNYKIVLGTLILFWVIWILLHCKGLFSVLFGRIILELFCIFCYFWVLFWKFKSFSHVWKWKFLLLKIMFQSNIVLLFLQFCNLCNEPLLYKVKILHRTRQDRWDFETYTCLPKKEPSSLHNAVLTRFSKP